MGLGDRIIIMEDGIIKQIGTPKEIYEKPDNLFVAKFIGSPAMNILSKQYYYIGFRPENLEIEEIFKGSKDDKPRIGIIEAKKDDYTWDQIDKTISQIQDITNVSNVQPTEGQTFTWDSGEGKWAPWTIKIKSEDIIFKAAIVPSPVLTKSLQII